MVSIVFVDGPLQGKRLSDSNLPPKPFLFTTNKEHMYSLQQRHYDNVPGTKTQIELERTYTYVKDAEWTTKQD